jgi:hypothetical protein
MGFMKPKVKTPPVPTPTPLPAPPQPASNPAVLAAGQNARSMIGGIASTYGTAGGAQGDLTTPNTGFKSLLGQ